MIGDGKVLKRLQKYDYVIENSMIILSKPDTKEKPMYRNNATSHFSPLEAYNWDFRSATDMSDNIFNQGSGPRIACVGINWLRLNCA